MAGGILALAASDALRNLDQRDLTVEEENKVVSLAPSPPPPPPRTKWTRRVPRPVLIGHAASLTPY